MQQLYRLRFLLSAFTACALGLSACAVSAEEDGELYDEAAHSLGASSQSSLVAPLEIPEALQAEEVRPAACFNTACTLTSQCRTWCNDSTAYCARILEGSPLKMCFVQ
jgi:hypothetical protein